MPTKLEIALAIAGELGLPVFPLAVNSKVPKKESHGVNDATTDPAQIKKRWTKEPDANIGVSCINLLAADVDVRNGKVGLASLAALEKKYGKLPATVSVTTASGGRHLLFRLPPGHPGVPNSNSKIGKDLDVKSTGGYLVGPGSTIDGKAYVLDRSVREIADAPQWLIDLCGTVTAKTADKGLPVPDALPDVLARAAEWLSTQAPAIEGQAGDAHTYTVACGLRDRGVSAAQALELIGGDWNDGCSPPWGEAALRAKIANAYRYAQNEPGERAITLDGFSKIDPLASLPGYEESKDLIERVRDAGWTVARKGQGFTVSRIGDPADPVFAEVIEESRKLGAKIVPITDTPQDAQGNRLLADEPTSQFIQTAKAGRYVVKNLLNRSSYAEIYGKPGCGKTFVALDLAYAIAQGRPWNDMKVNQGAVYYLPFEGREGLRRRVKALTQKYGVCDDLHILKCQALNLRVKGDLKILIDTIAASGEKPALIVIDTLARALMGGDENSAQDVGAFNAAVAQLIEATSACVLIIHHSGKDASKGARGSSALLGAIDTEIQIDDFEIITSKQRDVPGDGKISFALESIVVGVDEDGDAITSCVVVPSVGKVKALKFVKDSYPDRAREVLIELAPRNERIHEEEWKAACDVFLPVGEKRRRTWYDVTRALKKAGFITIDAGGYIDRLQSFEGSTA